MTGRHESRLLAVQFLFQREFNTGDLAEALTLFWEGRKTGDKVRAFAEELIRGVETRLGELDDTLKTYAENWDINRMAVVDRNILRVGLFEMRHRPDIPPVVSINEAVELAKEFSGLEAGRFVNGILDRASKDLLRPARCAAPDARFTKPPAERPG